MTVHLAPAPARRPFPQDAGNRWQRRRAVLVRWAATWPCWLLTRAVLAFALQLGYPSTRGLLGDVGQYARWAGGLVHGHYPQHDPSWQYPPGAAGLFAAAHLLGGGGGGFRWAFVALMALADGWIFAVLGGRGPAARASWILGGLALGPLVLYRFDLVPTAGAVAALSVLAGAGAQRRRAVVVGALVAVGALVKVWPLVVLAAVARRRWMATASGAAGVGLVALVALLAGDVLGPAMGFAGQQRSRGLEIESLAALPWMLARCAEGSHTKPVTSYGAFEVHGGLVPVAVAAATVLTVAVLVVAAWGAWRGWAAPAPASFVLAVVLLLLLTAKVLSPQYLVWPLGLAAFAVTREATGPGSGGRRTAWLAVLTCFGTQIEYPLAFSPVAKADLPALLVLVLRQGLLVVFTASALADAAAGRVRWILLAEQRFAGTWTRLATRVPWR